MISNKKRPGGEKSRGEREGRGLCEEARRGRGFDAKGKKNRLSPLPHRKKINDKIRKQVIEASSFIVIRFQASNPGLWFWHCHIEWHLADGLALVVSTTA